MILCCYYEAITVSWDTRVVRYTQLTSWNLYAYNRILKSVGSG